MKLLEVKTTGSGGTSGESPRPAGCRRCKAAQAAESLRQKDGFPSWCKLFEPCHGTADGCFSAGGIFCAMIDQVSSCLIIMII